MREHTSRYTRPDDEELKKRLSKEQYDVMVNNGTERPFTSEYWDGGQEGIYVDAATGEPLFASYDKFTSGCGWPSFAKPLRSESVTTQRDGSHGMIREEVRSAAGDFHLGHVFEDGPRELGGMRYCINGAALRFVPLDEMEERGYGDLVGNFEKRRKQG